MTLPELELFLTSACDALRFCVTTDDSLLDEYRAFVQGFTAAFMTAYIQVNAGSEAM